MLRQEFHLSINLATLRPTGSLGRTGYNSPPFVAPSCELFDQHNEPSQSRIVRSTSALPSTQRKRNMSAPRPLNLPAVPSTKSFNTTTTMQSTQQPETLRSAAQHTLANFDTVSETLRTLHHDDLPREVQPGAFDYERNRFRLWSASVSLLVEGEESFEHWLGKNSLARNWALDTLKEMSENLKESKLFPLVNSASWRKVYLSP